MKIFISHTKTDIPFCSSLATAISDAGGDVWYDKFKLGRNEILTTIDDELRSRFIFIPILSPAALESEWVKHECAWAWEQNKINKERIILPVVAEAFSIAKLWSFIGSYPRVEEKEGVPYPQNVAIRLTLECLGLPPVVDAAPEPQTITTEGMQRRGDAFREKKQYQEALDAYLAAEGLLQDNKQQGHLLMYKIAPMYEELHQPSEAEKARRKAIALYPRLAH